MEECRNCGTTDADRNIEGGICERCFRSMPMGTPVTPGTWQPSGELESAADDVLGYSGDCLCELCGCGFEAEGDHLCDYCAGAHPEYHRHDCICGEGLDDDDDDNIREASAKTFDSKYPCLNEKCDSTNYKLTGFTEAMTHYFKTFGNPAPIFTCTKCGEDGSVGNDIERLRDMGQELKSQSKGKSMSEDKTSSALNEVPDQNIDITEYLSEDDPVCDDCNHAWSLHGGWDGEPLCTVNLDSSEPDCDCGEFKNSKYDNWYSKTSSVKTALENPFDGYGRPFSEDPLNPNVDPAYYGDNPASDTKPYAGPNSYSINTTAPYMPPNSGMEDPGQNVGPYSPPGYEEEAAEFGLVGAEGIQTTAKSYDSWNSETEWFDGTSDSIYRRIASAREIQKTADKATANLIEEQVKVLEKVANEFADSSLAEYMTSVPGGTVAMDYDDLMDGGLVDLSSFISTEAHKYITEVNAYDWNKFASDAPRMWVTAKAQNNPGVLRHEGATREAAVDYVASKTMVLMDPAVRADIIDNFVSDVEVERRSYLAAADRNAEVEAARKAEFERQQRARVAAELNELEYADEDTLFPGQTTVGSNDPFDFGADDGSAMYAEAKKVVEAHSNRNWESFCTDGARDWFYSNDTPMFRYADTTRHAAKQYLDEETTLIKDPAFKNEIRRAFLASVDFLREEWLEKQASLQEPEEDIDVLSQYYDDETLW